MHTWILERRNRLARGIYNRLLEDARFSGEQTPAEAQWRQNTLISGGGDSAYQMVFGSNPVDLYGLGEKDEYLMVAQDTSLSGQFVKRWKLGVMAQEAALKEVANSTLRRLLASNKSSTCTDVKIGGTALFYKAQSKKSAPRWRGPALISDTDETGVTAKFQS